MCTLVAAKTASRERYAKEVSRLQSALDGGALPQRVKSNCYEYTFAKLLCIGVNAETSHFAFSITTSRSNILDTLEVK